MFTFNTISILIAVFYVAATVIAFWLAFRFVKSNERIADCTNKIANILAEKYDIF